MAESQISSLNAGVLQALAGSGAKPSAGPFPLSYAQESLWFVEQMAPGRATYNLPEAWRLEGRLNLQILQQSLDELVRRHEILRTEVQARNGRPQQFILGAARIALELIELPRERHPEAELQQRMQTEAERPFCLSRAPLARATLFRRGPEEHVLVLNQHHLIADAWSQRLFLRELAQTYCALLEARQPGAPPLPIQYADFALWQRELVESEGGRADLKYWRDVLRKPFKPLRLPLEYGREGLPSDGAPRPGKEISSGQRDSKEESETKSAHANTGHHGAGNHQVSLRLGEGVGARDLAAEAQPGAVQYCEVPSVLTGALRELSRKEGVTLFMTLLAGFEALLARHTLAEDILIGSPMACRSQVELEGLLGLFVNTHPLRCDVSANPSFRELLGRVREMVLGAYAHQELPCEVVLQRLPAIRREAGHPLFDIVFGWQGAALDCLDWPGGRATRMELDTNTAKFQWTVLVSECQDGRLRLRSEFSTQQLEPESMARLMQQYLLLLEGAAADPESRISELPLASPAEQRQLLAESNQAPTQYERNSCIHELFEAQAQRNPEAVALSFAGREMSYGVLNARANDLAHRLRAAGVRRGMRVGLCLDRSMEMIIGLLGILKAGGAYVPIDRTYPTQRVELMLKDSACSVLVTDSAWSSRVPTHSNAVQVVHLDSDPSAPTGQNQPALPSDAKPTSPAYVMFTSGSTGTPKGVLVPHRAVVRLVRHTNYLPFSDKLVFLQLAPITFDASTFEIWGALLNGARLVIYPPGVPSLAELGRVIRDSGITTLWLTSGLFHQMVDEQLENLRGLKHLLAGGDVLSPSHVARASRELTGCQVINGYGPTENTTFTCCYRVPRDWPEERVVPIGQPISQTRLYVLDSRMTPVPIGVPGELYVAGDGLADGYLNQPELTAKKFVPNPFEPDSCARLYRTGDLARRLADGNLEFLGRADAQVKIRGFRVEPGEIECVLARHPTVGMAAVTVGNQGGSKQLLAYVVPRPAQQVVEADLREFLTRQLPSFMVPSRVVVLDALPLTPNGKLDRAALSQAEEVASPAETEPEVLPRTALETTLAGIWSEVLGRSGVGVRADFFQLGGHSLLATQVISRIARNCGVELPVTALFEAPTLERLAALIERIRGEQFAAPARDIPRADARAAELLERLDELSEAELDALLAGGELKHQS